MTYALDKTGQISLTKKQEKAAWLLAEDEVSDADIARQCGVSRATLGNWKALPEFTNRIHELRAEMAANLARYHIARREKRMAAYQDRWERQHRIIAERADDPTMQDVPGGSTGMIVRTHKQVGSGPNAELVEEYSFDGSLDAAMRATEKQASQEAGQWIDKGEVNVSGEIVVRRYIGVDIDVAFGLS